VALKRPAQELAPPFRTALVGAGRVERDHAAAVLHKGVESVALGVGLKLLVVGNREHHAFNLLEGIRNEHRRVVGH